MPVQNHRDFGLVLDPVQFAAELATLKQRPQYDGHALYCQLPDHVARLFESTLVPTAQGLAISESDAMMCAIVKLQAASTQVVCIVPLLNAAAKAWLFEAVETLHRMNVVVSIADRPQVIVVTSGPPVLQPDGPEWQTIRTRVDEAPVEGDFVTRTLEMVTLLKRLEESQESLVPGFEVGERWVVACMPPPAPGVDSDVDVRQGERVQAPAGAVLH
jgi:hypothetical protein